MNQWTDTTGNLIEEIPEQMIGFVYLITDLISGKKYIGKKNFYKPVTKMVKGKKKKSKIESDWKAYFGSNKTLLEEIKTNGTDQYPRQILHFCKSKGTMNYMELREQIDRRALESDDYYNEYIIVRVNQSHLKF